MKEPTLVPRVFLIDQDLFKNLTYRIKYLNHGKGFRWYITLGNSIPDEPYIHPEGFDTPEEALEAWKKHYIK